VAMPSTKRDPQGAHFGDRLQVEIDVEAGCEDVLVPSLLLQPPVENSVGHVAAGGEA
jgi:LytS/YehU family sensor histidine kinase